MALPVSERSEKRQTIRTHPLFGSFRLNKAEYARINAGRRRDQYLHRAVWEEVAGRPVPKGFDIHHMNGKGCVCPHQLVALQKELHVPPEPLRCPHTGEWLTVDNWLKRFGALPERMA